MAKIDTRKSNKITAKINSSLNKLCTRKDSVLVPTEKTHTVKLLATTLYSNLVLQHLQEYAKLTYLAFVKQVKKDAIDYLEQNKSILSDQEYNYIKSNISKCISPYHPTSYQGSQERKGQKW